MIKPEQCVSIFLENVPEFSETWDKHTKYWENEPAGICNDLSVIARFLYDSAYLRQENSDILKRSFNTIEKLLADGDENVKGSIEVCLLEDLLNTISNNKNRSMSPFMKYIGPATLDAIKNNDAFWGTHAPGL